MIKLSIININVSDVKKAMEFYTEKLGFKVKRNIKSINYVTLTDEFDSVEMLLEPTTHPVSYDYQRGLYENGIPATSFEVDDINKVCEELKAFGVKITKEPTKVFGSTIALFDDTCGNYIQLHEVEDE